MTSSSDRSPTPGLKPRWASRGAAALWTACASLGAVGCQPTAVEPVDRWPLQPLIYTEVPELTPQAAQVRERRLMRELVEAQDALATRATRVVEPQLPSPGDAQALGQLLYDALIQRDETLWEHAFVSPASYAHMVHVRLPQAAKIVDEQLAQSLPAWNLFHVEHASEAPEGGLGSIFELAGLTLGQGRLATGRLARPEEVPEQYWGNVLKLRLRGAEVLLELHIPKILRVVDRRKSLSGAPMLALASAIKPSAELKTFVEAGLHLKPELLRSQEYPYPLAVGNFWRYRRAPEGALASAEPSLDAPLEGDESARVEVSEVLLEVTAVELYGPVRHVRLRRSFNDPQLTTQELSWLMTSRRLYDCSPACARHLEDIGWLLAYLHREEPLFELPLRPGLSWGGTPKQPRFRVARRLDDVEVPAGTFVGAILLSGVPQDRRGVDPFLEVSAQEVAFSPGRGVVRRLLRGVTKQGLRRELREELIESRIMP